MEVQALKNLNDINKIKRYLLKQSDKRNYVLFVFGINVGLRASDLLNLKVKDVINSDGTVKESFTLIEKKTDKIRTIKVNQSIKDALNGYINDKLPDEYLFSSRKEQGKLDTRSLNRLVKSWCTNCNIKGNYGSHSLRKTFGYHTYTNNANNPRILSLLQKIFNHSSPAITLRYIGIEQDEIDDIYLDLNL